MVASVAVPVASLVPTAAVLAHFVVVMGFVMVELLGLFFEGSPKLPTIFLGC